MNWRVYLKSHLSVFFVLLGICLWQALAFNISGQSVVYDVLCILCLSQLGLGYFLHACSRFKNFSAVLGFWALDHRPKQIVGALRFAFSGISISFILLWMSRWLVSLKMGLDPGRDSHFFNYLEAATFASFCHWLLSFSPIVKKLYKLDFSSARQTLVLYAGAVFIGAFVLILPMSLKPEMSLRLVDSFFVAVSALSVTGLSPINTAETFSFFGHCVLMFLIQIGGLGVVVLSAALALLSFKRLSLNSSLVGKELYDIPDIGNMDSFLAKVVTFTFAVEILGATLIYFSIPRETPDRVLHAVFHAISSFCNAGFSSFHANLDAPPMSVLGIWVIGLLVFLGGLGFPIVFEILAQKFSSQISSQRKLRLSANTRLTLAVTGFLLVGGTLAFFVLESVANSSGLQTMSRMGQSLFYAVSSRTAGFNMVPVSQFHLSTALLIMLLMFVGGGPLSTAGGIKTTTFGVLLSTAWSTLSRHRWVEFHDREIPMHIVMKSVTVVTLYVFLAVLSFLLLVISENLDSWSLLFEVISALSTVGLSLDTTAKLSGFGKLIIMFLMIVGRLGLVTIMYAGFSKSELRCFRYPEDRFYAG